jgi:hypothetical protein
MTRTPLSKTYLFFACVDVGEVVHEFAHLRLQPTGLAVGLRVVVHVGRRHGLHCRRPVVEAVVAQHVARPEAEGTRKMRRLTTSGHGLIRASLLPISRKLFLGAKSTSIRDCVG